MKVMTVFGTRPEAIKMCPLVLEMKKHPEIQSVVCLTGQHKEMLRQVMEAFGITENYNLNIMRPRQTISTILSDILVGMDNILEKEKPDIVLVHGDTSTSFAAALSAFNHHITVGHVEAGLRTYNKYSPFPEEMNRCLTARIADYHFAPTNNNRNNLLREGIDGEKIFVTGNTVIDSFHTTVKNNYVFSEKVLTGLVDRKRKIVLITAHRRENWGQPLQNICDAILDLARRYSDMDFVYPVHLNPVVRETVFGTLGEQDNIHLLDPLDVLDMHNLMSRSFLVLTDSGGLQEEAPAFGVPVLVLRTETERPEAVEAGTVKVVGVDKDTIINEARLLIESADAYHQMAHAVNPYGDGKASERIVNCILERDYSSFAD
ncbi:MAG: UDP-N-acetylglucosamine 2-epimerase (non-hydrolyzing) [Clostridia bacterium]|nr:UDP-N-acetylglucosamine 2-epimerase (non-hydrolyzing) [Clostridia bacterium]